MVWVSADTINSMIVFKFTEINMTNLRHNIKFPNQGRSCLSVDTVISCEPLIPLDEFLVTKSIFYN